MVEIDTGFSETSRARRAVEEDRVKARAFLRAGFDRIVGPDVQREVWSAAEILGELNRLADQIEEGKHVKS